MDDKRVLMLLEEERGNIQEQFSIRSTELRDLLDALTTAQARIAELEAAKPIEWRCFHCDEVFTDKESAEAHFGIAECDTPACKVSPDLAALLRMQEQELYKHRTEQTEMGLLYYKFGSDHCIALRKAEQEGYDKGLADGRAALEAGRHADMVAWVRKGLELAARAMQAAGKGRRCEDIMTDFATAILAIDAEAAAREIE